MPTYQYRREDGSTFEIDQSIKDDALTTCPTTGQPVTRIISGGTGLIFKGSGFYLTDYARKNSSAGSSGSNASQSDGASAKSASSTADSSKSSSSASDSGSSD
ncbi:MAG: zinc ribbon domain-containing protein [Bacteroidetes bacterium]|nr:zinc ribbon domain-containing protein [Bacteroidota bacterium]